MLNKRIKWFKWFGRNCNAKIQHLMVVSKYKIKKVLTPIEKTTTTQCIV